MLLWYCSIKVNDDMACYHSQQQEVVQELVWKMFN